MSQPVSFNNNSGTISARRLLVKDDAEIRDDLLVRGDTTLRGALTLLPPLGVLKTPALEESVPGEGISLGSTLKVDLIEEKTEDAGVSIGSTLNVDFIDEKTTGSGVLITNSNAVKYTFDTAYEVVPGSQYLPMATYIYGNPAMYANSTTLTVLKSGVYCVVANIVWAPDSNGTYRSASIKIDCDTCAYSYALPSSVMPVTQSVCCIAPITVGQPVRVRVIQDHVSSVALYGDGNTINLYYLHEIPVLGP